MIVRYLLLLSSPIASRNPQLCSSSTLCLSKTNAATLSSSSAASMSYLIMMLLTILTAFVIASDAKPASPTILHPRHSRTHHHLHCLSRSGSSRSSIASSAFVSTSTSPIGGGRDHSYNNVHHREWNSIDRLMSSKAGNVDIIDTSASADADYAVNNGDRNDYVDRGLRFAGVGRLYANKDTTITPDTVLNRLTSATVAIIGLGGVGSWAAESLCRSGVGNLLLVDLDDICISNTNRQLHATASAVGRMKIDEMKTRLLDINPECNVTLVHDFVTKENANDLVREWNNNNDNSNNNNNDDGDHRARGGGLTAVLDAIDGMQEKTALILACVDHNIPIVTCGGAAGRTDPTQIVVDDLTKVTEDRLLFKCRKLLRQTYGFPKVDMPKSRTKSARVRKWRIPAVYSTEVQQQTKMNANASSDDNESTSSFRTCDGALGTGCFVTGTYGFVAACKIVEMIALDKMVVPKKLGKKPQ